MSVARTLILAAALSAPASALGAESEWGTFSFTLDNDLFYGDDRHYTNGVRFAWVTNPDAVPDWLTRTATTLPFFPDHGVMRGSFSLGQNMFTPENIEVADPPTGDRPYAGWLYVSAGLIADTGSRLDRVELSLGVVGPAALGEQTQKTVHSITGSPEPRGWDTQLENEPAILLTWQRAWQESLLASVEGFGLDMTPHVGAALGNVFTYASGGVILRFGRDLPHDYGPPLIQPAPPGSGFFLPQDSFGWYLFAGFEGRAVARNIFLDGNTFRDSRSVDKIPLVGDLQLGLAVTVGQVRIAYTHILRTPEFEGQQGLDNYGAISASLRF